LLPPLENLLSALIQALEVIRHRHQGRLEATISLATGFGPSLRHDLSAGFRPVDVSTYHASDEETEAG
jgi:hypothetical protein